MTVAVDHAVYCEVDPATRVLTVAIEAGEACRYSAFLFENGPKALANQNPTRIGTAAPLSASDRLILSRCVHEHDHLYRFIYSPYGNLLHRMRSAEVDSFIKGLFTESPAFRCTAPAVSAIEGAYRHADPPNRHVCRLLKDFAELRLRPVTELEERLLPYLSTNHPAPIVDGYAIGGKAILELLAFNREITIARYTASANEDWDTMLDATQETMEDYNRAQVAWRRLVADPLVQPPAARKSWTAAGASPTRSVLPLEIYLAADLALWVPFFPPRRELDREWAWSDVHPGWRFLRTVHWLDRNARPFASHDDFPGPFEQAYEPLMNTICDHFGWIRPRELADAWLDWSRDAYAAQTTGQYFIEQDSHRLMAIGELLNTWKRTPCAFSLTLPEFEQRQHLWFSGIETSDGCLLDPRRHVPECRIPRVYAVSNAQIQLCRGARGCHYFNKNHLIFRGLIDYVKAIYGTDVILPDLRDCHEHG